MQNFPAGTKKWKRGKKYESLFEAMLFEHAAVLILSCLRSNYWPSVNKLCV